MYRLIDHTGDIGIEIKNKTIEGLLEDAILGLYAIFLEPIKQEIRGERNIIIEYNDLEELLVEILNEMIFLFDTERIIFLRFKDLKISKGKLYGVFEYDIFDSKRYKVLSGGVKAATYHNLKVSKINGEYYARVIIDI